jgi:hypothetical protein
MIALLFSIAIVLFAGAIGLSVVALLDRRVSLGMLLVSPAIGVGILLAATMSLSRAGLPVEAFGTWLILAAGIIAAAILAWRKPTSDWSRLRALAPIYAVGLLLAGAPMLAYGFNWAGNANADMAIYAASATNFLHHGMYAVPSMDDLVRGVDVARNLWFWEVLPPNRFGTDALVALAAAVSRVEPYRVYMTCGVASFVMLCMAVSALCANWKRPVVMGASVLIAAASPLMLYTVYQQILPQLLGQVALVAIVALLSMETVT